MLKEISSEHRSIGEARKFLQEITTIISLLLSIGLLESKKKIKDSMPHADFIFIKHSYWKCLPCLQPRCYPLQNEKKKNNNNKPGITKPTCCKSSSASGKQCYVKFANMLV